MQNEKWARLLAYVSGLVNQRLLLQCEYLAAENRILRSHLPPRLRLSDPERSTLAEIGKRLGRTLLAEVACVAKPETFWLVPAADCAQVRCSKSRRIKVVRINETIEALIVRMRGRLRLGVRRIVVPRLTSAIRSRIDVGIPEALWDRTEPQRKNTT